MRMCFSIRVCLKLRRDSMRKLLSSTGGRLKSCLGSCISRGIIASLKEDRIIRWNKKSKN